MNYYHTPQALGCRMHLGVKGEPNNYGSDGEDCVDLKISDPGPAISIQRSRVWTQTRIYLRIL